MTVFHNVSAHVKPHKTTNLQDKELLVTAIRHNAEEIVRRVLQNTEPIGGGIRIRIMLERADT
jgi:hypothetical protein